MEPTLGHRSAAKLAALSISTAWDLSQFDDAEKGVLIACGEADLTCIEQYFYGQGFHWFSAPLDFEVKFREQCWQLVSSSISMRLEVNDEEGFIEDSIDDYPPTAFWD